MSGFEEHLKKARTHAGLSQPELAERVGVDKSYISKLERGVESPPSRKVAVKLADSVGMSNRPVTLYVSTKDRDALQRFLFFLEANVASAEDVQTIRLVEEKDGEAQKEEGQDISNRSESDLLAATGTYGSPSSLGDDQGQHLPTFEERVRQIVTSFNLPYAKRMIAQQMSEEAIRIICWGLKEAE